MQSVHLQGIKEKYAAMGYKKTNPIKACPERTCPEQGRRSRMGQFQTGTLNRWQDEPKILSKFINSCYARTLSKNDGNEVDISTRLCHYI